MRAFATFSVALFLATGCSLILTPLEELVTPDADGDADSDADGDTDADGDGDGDVDGDTDGDGDGDGDVDADADHDSDADDEPIGSFVESVFIEAPDGPFPAATSVVLQPVLTWSGEPTHGVTIEYRTTGGGLVGHYSLPAWRETVRSTTLEEGAARRLRLTFPLSHLDSYSVGLEWRRDGEDLWHELPTVYEVVEHETTSVLIDGTGEWINLPRGLVAELYVDPLPCPTSYFDGWWNTVTSLAVTRGEIGNLLVVSCLHDAWFVPLDVTGLWSHHFAPGSEDATGPDLLFDVAFSPARGADPVDRVFGVGGGIDGGEGLYAITSDGILPSQVIDEANCAGLDVVRSGGAFPVGVYWGAFGYIHRYDPSTDADEQVLGEYRPWPLSISVGDDDVYGDYSMLVVRCNDSGACAQFAMDRVDNEGNVTWTLDLQTRMPKLEASPGAVFGDLIYATESSGVAMLLPSHSDQVDFIPIIDGLLLASIQITFQHVYLPIVEYHPAGLYLLQGIGPDPRVIRIYQDLS